MLVPIDEPDSSTEHAAFIGDVANKSLGTDMPMSMADEAAALLLIDWDLDGMGMGIDDDDDNCVLKTGVLLLLLLLLLELEEVLFDDDKDEGTAKPDAAEASLEVLFSFEVEEEEQVRDVCSPILAN
jgi:hypothetical protein